MGALALLAAVLLVLLRRLMARLLLFIWSITYILMRLRLLDLLPFIHHLHILLLGLSNTAIVEILNHYVHIDTSSVWRRLLMVRTSRSGPSCLNSIATIAATRSATTRLHIFTALFHSNGDLGIGPRVIHWLLDFYLLLLVIVFILVLLLLLILKLLRWCSLGLDKNLRVLLVLCCTDEKFIIIFLLLLLFNFDQLWPVLLLSILFSCWLIFLRLSLLLLFPMMTLRRRFFVRAAAFTVNVVSCCCFAILIFTFDARWAGITLVCGASALLNAILFGHDDLAWADAWRFKFTRVVK